MLTLRLRLPGKGYIPYNKFMGEKILAFFMVSYAIVASGFIAYFNYLYAVENGFVAWLLFGEIVATFKGLLWPLYI